MQIHLPWQARHAAGVDGDWVPAIGVLARGARDSAKRVAGDAGVGTRVCAAPSRDCIGSSDSPAGASSPVTAPSVVLVAAIVLVGCLVAVPCRDVFDRAWPLRNGRLPLGTVHPRRGAVVAAVAAVDGEHKPGWDAATAAGAWRQLRTALVVLLKR